MLGCFRTTIGRMLPMQINNQTLFLFRCSFTQTAFTSRQTSDSPSISFQPPTPKSQRMRRSTSPHQGHKPVSSPRSHSEHITPGSPRTASPSSRGALRSNFSRGYRDNYSRNNSRSRLADREKERDTLELPLRDENHIKQAYQDVNISASIVDNPKTFLANFVTHVLGAPLDFKYEDGTINRQKLWRFVHCVLRVSSGIMIW